MRSNGDITRNELERQAELLRARLSSTLAELDRRRHQILNLRTQAWRHPGPVLGTGAMLLGAAVGGGALLAYQLWRIYDARRHPVRRHLGALWQIVSDPERVLRTHRPSLFQRISGGVLSNVLGLVATEAVRRLLLPPPQQTLPEQSGPHAVVQVPGVIG